MSDPNQLSRGADAYRDPLRVALQSWIAARDVWLEILSTSPVGTLESLRAQETVRKCEAQIERLQASLAPESGTEGRAQRLDVGGTVFSLDGRQRRRDPLL